MGVDGGVPSSRMKQIYFQVSTNGLISFSESFVGTDPVSLNRSDFTSDNFNRTVAAPFWFRQDLRRTDPANQ